MGTRLFVGNLSFQITETDLSNMFGEIGQVESVQIITDRDTGRSKGFGFVQVKAADTVEFILRGLAGFDRHFFQVIAHIAQENPAA